MGGIVWDLNSTIISPYLLLDTAHSFPTTYLRWVDVITESKYTHACCMFLQHTHTHTRSVQIIPWCHRSYFTNNGPHVCSGLQGCVRQGLGSMPSLKPCQDHCKFLLVFSSCNLRARCAGDCVKSQINSLLHISFPCIYGTWISIHHNLWSKQILFSLN